jgi:hypothetical protein
MGHLPICKLTKFWMDTRPSAITRGFTGVSVAQPRFDQDVVGVRRWDKVRFADHTSRIIWRQRASSDRSRRLDSSSFCQEWPMATSAQMSMTEYFHSIFEPDAEYVNGEIEQRNVGEYDHNAVQKAILIWFGQHDKGWRTRSIQEQRTRLKSGNVRLPNVSVFPRDLLIEQVFTRPQLIAIEVLSPEDRQSIKGAGENCRLHRFRSRQHLVH